jgi:hypothetical protein
MDSRSPEVPMVAELHALPPPPVDALVAVASEPSPHGKRYDAEQKEACYLLWSTTAKRSLQAVSRTTGISPSTLGTWHQRDRWQERYEAEQAERAALLRLSIVGKVAEEIDSCIDTLIEIKNDKSAANRDRITSTITLLSLAGLNPNAKPDPTAQAKPVPRYSPPDDDLPIDDSPEAAYQRIQRRRELGTL